MIDISSALASPGNTESSKEITSFSKKNAWKNEWEKAQLENQANTQYKKDDKQSVSTAKESIMVEHSLKSEPTMGVVESSVHLGQIDKQSASVANTTYVSNASLLSGPVPEFDGLFISAVNINKANLDNSLKSSSHSATSKTAEHMKGVVQDVEARFMTKFKLQNLIINLSDSSAKVILRDYRLEKNEIHKIIEEIRNHLNDLGIDINKTVVNGVVDESR